MELVTPTFTILAKHFHYRGCAKQNMPHIRPEVDNPPEIFYDDKEASKYCQNSHMIEIQTKLAERALELCNLDENKPAFILDVGCGSGLSCGVIENHGYSSIGIDISQPMINVGKSRGCDDVILADMGLGVPFRPATFDACISISALQWLCNSYASDQIPSARLLKFFTSLYACMKISSRTVFHFYPSDHQQIELINRSALKAGFTGGVLIDYPNSTRAKNYFLCLFVGIQMPAMPQPLTESESAQDCRSFGKKKHKLVKKSKAWINAKKESMAKKGIEVRPFSKYSGRRRKPKF